MEVIYKRVEAVKQLGKTGASQKGEVIETKKMNNSEIEIYHLSTNENILAASITVGPTSYDIGEIGYGDMDHFPIEQIDVLGNTCIKIIGATGANSPIANYVLPDSELPLTCISRLTL